ncbi:beta-adducin isoform X1 [Bufo gargarizans]|uniref:beta-adducin isoform X1 n=1 Tax=Bufo gargarizans TaxID=30331 RepID=UPI001CF4889C|nr:beta-adducin isoform X1 [Bufo gargarizans]XP_044135229.1 beta-adducin isoform X1 [Bufo gargarizans]XP_044135230.1 beta-adducin isoform X1 [Bufo gargarizans]XP_044135231.1 beta-adducin isoform X1 [Bufo gargarizans]
MSNQTTPEAVTSPPLEGLRYFERYTENDPEYLRIRNMAADLRQDFNVMEQKKRVTMILQSPSFREELESLIQEQMNKGNNSSNIWALRQIADFMASTAPSVFPTCPVNSSLVAPINDLHCNDPVPLAKGERLMRCKLASIYRLIDLYGWAQLSGTFASIRVNKEQDHFLINPRGVACSEVSASILVKVNILGEMVEVGSSSFEVDASDFSLHSAIYSARPDVKCIIQLHTAATTAVSAMKCGLLPISHDALLAGELVYYDFNGDMEEEKDRIELQKCLGPTCKVLVLRNHGVVSLGESVEEAFYKIFHLQAACEIQASAVPSAGGSENLILLDREKYRPHEVGTVGWAGSMFGPMQKSRLGEHEFEALMRMMDNLGYRTGYTYRHPFVQEKTRHKSDVEIPATVTAFVFEEEGVPLSTLRQHAQKQQKEKTRWLNTPNTYLRVNVAEESVSSQRSKTTWLKADEVVKPSSGMPIRIENPNQFVPLFTDPREVLETRNKIREQNRQDVKSAGPQSQLLASVITDKSRSPSADTQLATKTEAELREQPVEEVPPEPEPPNPFSLTDQELEEYKEEVERKKHATDDKEAADEDTQPSLVTPPTSPVRSPTKTTTVTVSPSKSSEEAEKEESVPESAKVTEEKVQPAVVLNGKEEDQPPQDETPPKVTETPKGKNETVPNASPEGSPTKSPSKKKKKFRTPSFLKKGKKKDKEKAES